MLAQGREPIEGVRPEAAVSVNHDHRCGRSCFQKPQAPIQRVALANPVGVLSHRYFGAGAGGDRRGLIRTIVGDYNQSISGQHLPLHVSERWLHALCFVVGGHKHRHAASPCASW